MQLVKRQRGIATVLTVVLLGMALTSATLVGVSQLRSSQEMSVSLHAQTMAQKRANLGFGHLWRQFYQQLQLPRFG